MPITFPILYLHNVLTRKYSPQTQKINIITNSNNGLIDLITTVPLKWINRSLKELKYSLLGFRLRLRRFEFVILQAIKGFAYEQR